MSFLWDNLKNYLLLMRLHKPIGILLLLWPTLWALWLAADGKPDISIVLIFILGVIVMRSAGCVINDIADRQFDGLVMRTKERPLVSGKVSVKAALILFGLLIALAFMLVLLLNGLSILLAIIGALLAIGYPFLKRFTHLPQAGLGLAFSWGVPMAFAAELNEVPTKAWILFIAAAIWPVIYDTFYAMVDRADDIKAGVKSTAILFGKNDRLVIGLLQGLFLILMIVIGKIFQLNFPYYLGLLMAALLCVYQQVICLRADTRAYFKAFLNNNWVGLIIFSGILLSGA
jgi:4-hydroxybenzoate polyprenyltransferase